MKQKLKYDIPTISLLGAIKVVVSPYVLDDKIIMRGPRDLTRQPSLSPKTYAAYHISIWDLETGVVAGDCDPTKATEWHMSAKRFKQLKEMVDDFEFETAKEIKGDS